ncbi:MAG: hypothetical protein HY866_17025, partial [Chloroflexi bacterium]|nr:hypothetical protein [Chloroflexota bacterium]
RTIDEEDVVDGQFSFDAPPVPNRLPDGYNSRPDYSTYQVGESKYASATPAVQPAPARPQVITPVNRSPQIESQSSGETDGNGLSLQERHQLLIHTIGLYSDEWKLAGIRANAQRNRLEAYLVPLNHHMDLKQAISKNIALLIMIDCQGNTDIREPKPKGPLRRLGGWFFGGE